MVTKRARVNSVVDLAKSGIWNARFRLQAQLALRQGSNWTQKRVASLLGIGEATYAERESNPAEDQVSTTALTVDFMAAVALVLHSFPSALCLPTEEDIKRGSPVPIGVENAKRLAEIPVVDYGLWLLGLINVDVQAPYYFDVAARVSPKAAWWERVHGVQEGTIDDWGFPRRSDDFNTEQEGSTETGQMHPLWDSLKETGFPESDYSTINDVELGQRILSGCRVAIRFSRALHSGAGLIPDTEYQRGEEAFQETVEDLGALLWELGQRRAASSAVPRPQRPRP